MEDILDFRSLGPQAQEQLRFRAVKAALNEPYTQTQIARIYSVSRTSVTRWLYRNKKNGKKALKANLRGTHKKGGKLTPAIQAWTAKAIVDHTPRQMNLPYDLWTRAAVGVLIKQEFGIMLSDRTVGRYLRKWNFTPQRPRRVACEQNPIEVHRFLHHRYPAIVRSAREHKAVILWEDEVGFRSNDQGGRSYGRRGQTPTIPGTANRFGCNVLIAIGANGLCRTMQTGVNVNAMIFIMFLTRLLYTIHQMIYLMIDQHSIHIAGAVSRWIRRHADRIRIFFLPKASPEVNPAELIINDVKNHSARISRPRDKWELFKIVRRYLLNRAHKKSVIQNYFEEEHVIYILLQHILRPP